jgi:hypothetical protein
LFLGTRGDVDDIVAACRKVHENRSSLIAFEHAKSASLVSH